MSADAGSALARAAGRVRAPFEGPNTMGNSIPFWAVFAIGVLALAAYPMTTNPFRVQQTTQFFAVAFLALSLCLVWGYCGVLSFGQVAFFGVGAYAYGIIGINYPSATGITLAIVGAILAGAAFAAVLGYFMFYGGVRDVYVTIITLVVALVLKTFLDQTADDYWAIGEARLGGFNGMPGIPDLVLGVGETGFVLDRMRLYYALLVVLALTYLGLRALVNSRFGMTMVAVREDEERTATFGYNVAFVKLVAFTVGGALAAAGGVFYAGWGNYIDPSRLSIAYAALPVVWVSVGGRESLLGAIGATMAIEKLRTAMTDGLFGVLGPEWADVIVGGLLLGVILLLPAGVAPYINRAGRRALDRLGGGSSPSTTEEAPE